MKNKRMTITDYKNIATERFLYKRFELLALNIFEYEIPDDLNVEERHIENFLLNDGDCYWFEDETYGLLCLRGSGFGEPNVLGDYVKYRVTGRGYSKVIDADKCVRMRNNKLSMPTWEVIAFFTDQLYEIVRTRDTNIKTLKLPFVLSTTDKNLLTTKKIMEAIDNNEPCLTVNKEVQTADELVKVLPTGVKPFTAELTDQYHDILNEALTYLGINNANTDKKERLITSEANANNQFIDSCVQMFLESRQKACDEIKEKFGVEIKVKLRNKGEEDNALQYDTQSITTNEQSDNPGA